MRAELRGRPQTSRKEESSDAGCVEKKELFFCQTTSLCVQGVWVLRKGTTQSFCLHPLLFARHNNTTASVGRSCSLRYNWSPITSLQHVQYGRDGKLKWYYSVNNIIPLTRRDLQQKAPAVSPGPAVHLPPDEDKLTKLGEADSYGGHLVHLIPGLTSINVNVCSSERKKSN